jgi:hypothetical protein
MEIELIILHVLKLFLYELVVFECGAELAFAVVGLGHRDLEPIRLQFVHVHVFLVLYE